MKSRKIKIEEGNLELNEKTKKELVERMKNTKLISHEKVKEILELKNK